MLCKEQDNQLEQRAWESIHGKLTVHAVHKTTCALLNFFNAVFIFCAPFEFFNVVFIF